MFASWTYINMLSAAGWPRRAGLFRREVVNSLVADSLAKVLLDAGMAIGAQDVPLACSLIAETFSEREDWGVDLDETLQRQYLEGRDPLASYGEEVPAKLISSSAFQSIVAFDFAAALWHATCNPDEVSKALTANASGNRRTARRAIDAGMDVNPDQLPSSAEGYLDLARELVGAYEATRGPIPDAPAPLIRLAESVRCDSAGSD